MRGGLPPFCFLFFFLSDSKDLTLPSATSRRVGDEGIWYWEKIRAVEGWKSAWERARHKSNCSWHLPTCICPKTLAAPPRRRIPLHKGRNAWQCMSQPFNLKYLKRGAETPHGIYTVHIVILCYLSVARGLAAFHPLGLWASILVADWNRLGIGIWEFSQDALVSLQGEFV